MSVFKGSDIVEFAVRIEENGENFYRYAVQLAKDEETKGIFLNLAVAEAHHKRTFEKIFAIMEKEKPPETYDGEYAAYLHNYVDNNIIFKKEVMEKELAQVKDVLAAIDFAIRRELDSILYYHEIKRFVPTSEHAVIEEVIEEERKHFKGLSNLRTRHAK
jgi:rubrerythrin